MGAAVNVNAFKSPTGILKIVNVCLVIIVIVLARAGWKGAPVAHILDPLWLTSITTGAYILILGTILFSYLLGEQVPYKMEAIFMFIGTILFLAIGSLSVESYQYRTEGYIRDTGLALGSIAIITGIFMFIDTLLLVKTIVGK
jgi:hypothetical protein